MNWIVVSSIIVIVLSASTENFQRTELECEEQTMITKDEKNYCITCSKFGSPLCPYT